MVDSFHFHQDDIISVGYIKNIYDVTVAYADAIVQSEFELFYNGSCPKNIHFHVSKVDIDSLPKEDDELTADWLTDRWKTKEEKLAQFYHSDDAQYRAFKIDSNYDEVFGVSSYWFLDLYHHNNIYFQFRCLFIN